MALALFLLLIPAAVCSPAIRPVDCHDLYVSGSGHSGVYTIYPAGPASPIQVYCDMGCEDEPSIAKWTVIQRRQDGNINFYRGLHQFKIGFGQASGEYWLGLENIHLLSQQKSYELRIDLEDFEGAKVYVQYSNFSVAPAAEGYRLRIGGFKNGGAGAAFSEHNGLRFSTFDKDQDNSPGTNCAKKSLGGWWYDKCHSVNLNGLYMWGSSTLGFGINWKSWKGLEYSLKHVAMKIRPTKNILE